MYPTRHPRRLRLAAVAAVAVVALTTMVALAGAAIDKTTYIVAECNGINLMPGDWTYSGDTAHMRNMSNRYEVWVRERTAWREIGTVTTYPNANISPQAQNIWGTFDLRDDGTIGSFNGSFNWSMGNNGPGSGRSADGRLVKITLGVDPTPYLPLPFPAGACDVREYVVMTPQG